MEGVNYVTTLDEILELQLDLAESVTEAAGASCRAHILAKKVALLAAFAKEGEHVWEGLTYAEMIKKIIDMRFALVREFGWNDSTREYINEAQHQDGITYWLNFPNKEDVIYDYGLYIQA